MTEDALYDHLQAYLVAIDQEAEELETGHQTLSAIIREHQTAPRPTGPYASLNLVARADLGEVRLIGYDEREIGGTPRVIEKTAHAYEWRFTVSVFASEPLVYADMLANALRSGRASVDLAPLQVRRVSDPQRVPELVQQHYEGRAQFDVDLAGIAIGQLLIDVIESGQVIWNDAAYKRQFATLTYEKD